MMTDWLGSSKRVRDLGEQVVVLRAEIAGLRDEWTSALAADAGRQAAIAALKQDVDDLRDHVHRLVADEVSQLRETLNHQSSQLDRWRAATQEEEQRYPAIDKEHKRLEMAVLKLEKRLQLQDEQTAKATTALFERIELLRRPEAPNPNSVEH